MKAPPSAALMVVDRPMFSRRFSAEFAASAMDDGDNEHIGTYLDNIEREAPRTVDSAVGECPTEAPIGVGTISTEPHCDPNLLSTLTPVSAAMPRRSSWRTGSWPSLGVVWRV